MPNTVSDQLTIADLLSGDSQLTTPPNIYFELQKIIDDPNKSLTDAGFIIEKDPALSIRLLKLVNSAFFGLPGSCASINKAISLVGFKELQNLVLATLVIEKFSSMPGGVLSMRDFWAKSLQSALYSKELGSYWNIREDLDAIFICGLLHDIGQLVFFRRIPVLAREVGLLVEATGIDEVQAETNIIGFDHYQTGAELARLWKLPEIIITSLAQHNSPDYSGSYAKTAEIVRIGSQLNKMPAEDLHVDEISAEDLSQIIERVNDQFEQIFNIFYPN